MRLIFAGIICVAAGLVLPAAAFAESEITLRAERLIDAWKGWLNKHAVGEASIAVSFEGRTVAEEGFNRRVTDPSPVGSISKSVTGICVAKLVGDGKLSFDAALKDYVATLDSSVPVKSLLRQTSGYTHDITQRPEKYIGRDQEYLSWVSKKEIARGRDESQIGKFNYNNSNYAMLGAIIHRISGKTYEQTCKNLVFTPIGISNVFLNPDWRIMSSWGGWMISARDHLKFVNAYFGRDSILGKKAKDFPNHHFGNGVRYGMGYVFRNGRHGGTNFWHDGRWHTDVDGNAERFGAFFVSFDNGWVVTTNHNISAINGEHRELDNLIAEATHSPL